MVDERSSPVSHFRVASEKICNEHMPKETEGERERGSKNWQMDLAKEHKARSSNHEPYTIDDLTVAPVSFHADVAQVASAYAILVALLSFRSKNNNVVCVIAIIEVKNWSTVVVVVVTTIICSREVIQ